VQVASFKIWSLCLLCCLYLRLFWHIFWKKTFPENSILLSFLAFSSLLLWWVDRFHPLTADAHRVITFESNVRLFVGIKWNIYVFLDFQSDLLLFACTQVLHAFANDWHNVSCEVFSTGQTWFAWFYRKPTMSIELSTFQTFRQTASPFHFFVLVLTKSLFLISCARFFSLIVTICI